MATELRRLTFAVTKEMEPLLARAKKELFYDRTQSDMVRELVVVGLDTIGLGTEKLQKEAVDNDRSA